MPTSPTSVLRSSLDRLLRPVSLALVGASANPQALGGRTLANLRSWSGRLYLVNPNLREIGGYPCHASIDRLPEPVDCAVLAVPADHVEATLRQCAAAGVGAAIVFASGYAETADAAGRAAQQRLADLAVAGGIRLVGPNCVGVASHMNRLHAAFAEFPTLTAATSAGVPAGSAAASHVETGRIALVSQSGALALALSQTAERGVALTHVLTCGNSADVDVADYVEWLADQPECDAIALVYEGLADPDRVPAALRTAARKGKRVAWCKVGRSASGREAVRYHTATNAEPPASGTCRESGVVEVTPIESLMETAAHLAKATVPRARGVAVLSGSGGTGILAVDAADRAGVALPQPAELTQARLRAGLPTFASPRNPCDATAQSTRNPTSLLDAAAALLADDRYGALVIPWGRSQRAALLPALGDLGKRHGKPVCVVWMSPMRNVDTLSTIERDPALSLFFSLDACFIALAGWLG